MKFWSFFETRVRRVLPRLHASFPHPLERAWETSSQLTQTIAVRNNPWNPLI